MQDAHGVLTGTADGIVSAEPVTTAGGAVVGQHVIDLKSQADLNPGEPIDVEVSVPVWRGGIANLLTTTIETDSVVAFGSGDEAVVGTSVALACNTGDVPGARTVFTFTTNLQFIRTEMTLAGAAGDVDVIVRVGPRGQFEQTNKTGVVV